MRAQQRRNERKGSKPGPASGSVVETLNKHYAESSEWVTSHAHGFCACINHAERADEVKAPYEPIIIEEPTDPPLSEHGI